MRGIARKLFENYLGNRKQIVKYNQTCSAEAKITSGVPQGSILGPLLFLLYINDIENCSNIVSMILFADDTNIYHSHTCLKTLNDIMQIEINKIADWLIVNKLTINIKKTKFILFKSPKKRLNHSVTISINKRIDQVKSISFLGVNIDEHLAWKNHENSWNYSPSSTLCKFEYFKTSVLCFSLSIFNLCQFSLGKYLHKANSEVTKHTKKNCASNVI
jgi:hypothetical protein